MNETPATYVTRLLSHVGDQDPLHVMATTAGRLRSLIHGRTREDLARKPAPGRWSASEILAHLADAEIAGAWRFRSVLASDGVPLQPYDQNTWAEAFRYAECDPHESLALFDANRTGTLGLLRRVDRSLYAHHGLHAERGVETVPHLIALYAGHDLNHVAQIEQLVQQTP
jgi:hypothetical protein